VFPRLLLIFIIVPLLELLVIVEVSSRIGLPETILALIVISVLGAALAKREGTNAWQKIQNEMAQGRMPGDPLIEGGVILAGAVLLLTPGFITDALGLAMLFPPTRKAALALAKRQLKKSVVHKVTVWTADGNNDRPEPEQRRKELEN
jgi:UPF0716 protein FxsA